MGLPCFVKRVTSRERVGSNISTALQSDCETIHSETTGASSEAEKITSCSESANDSYTASCCESADDSVSAGMRHQRKSRRKKRKSGWSRQRRARFWQSVRELTPERWPES